MLIFNFLQFCQVFWLHNYPAALCRIELKSTTKSTKNTEATKVVEKFYEVFFVLFVSFVVKLFGGCILGFATFSAIAMVKP